MLRFKQLALVYVGIITACTLAACSTSSETQPAQPVTKEAGVRGSRICFINDTSLPMVASPSQRVVTENADHIVGVAGALSKETELCYAGWNSYLVKVMYSPDGGVSKTGDLQTDVSLSIGIDGNYNLINFRANNAPASSPTFNWTDNPAKSGYWPGGEMDVGGVGHETSGGHSFTVTRLEDSEFYKEFTVRFTQ